MIIVFSGTGNSLRIADTLSDRLGDKVVRLQRKGIDFPPDDRGRIIWVFPVYSWGVPPVVLNWMESLEIPGADSATHHAVMTCGDDCGLAGRMWRKAAEKRGWKTGEIFSVQMPNTYVLMKGFDVDSRRLTAEKLAKSETRVAYIAKELKHAKPGEKFEDVVRGSFPWIKTKIIYPWFVKFDMSPKPFHCTDDCTGCGTCSRVCPMQNITMEDNRPHWGSDCALCLGCYHACPHHAVAYGKITRHKGQKTVFGK